MFDVVSSDDKVIRIFIIVNTHFIFRELFQRQREYFRYYSIYLTFRPDFRMLTTLPKVNNHLDQVPSNQA
jgi:hypothetical protein